MLTVKLNNRRLVARVPGHPDGPGEETRFDTKIIECVEATVRSVKPHALVSLEVLYTGHHVENTRSAVFYLTPHGVPDPDIEPGVGETFYYSAYIENAAGKTTEVVQFA